jgi:hypothetical protein
MYEDPSRLSIKLDGKSLDALLHSLHKSVTFSGVPLNSESSIPNTGIYFKYPNRRNPI